MLVVQISSRKSSIFLSMASPRMEGDLISKLIEVDNFIFTLENIVRGRLIFKKVQKWLRPYQVIGLKSVSPLMWHMSLKVSRNFPP
jgi:hypothetical protein